MDPGRHIDPYSHEYLHHDTFISYSVARGLTEPQGRLELPNSLAHSPLLTDQSTKAQKRKVGLNSGLLLQNVTLFGDRFFSDVMKLK